MSGRQLRILKWVALSVVAAVLLVVLTIGGVLLALNQGWLDETLVARATDAIGREVSVDGEIRSEFALTPQITMTDVRIANAPWDEARSPHLLEADRFSFRIELLELLRGRLVFPSIDLSGAEAALTRREDGAVNWDLGSSDADAAAAPVDLPIVRDLSIDDSTIDYLDRTRELDVTLTLASVDAASGAGQRTRADGHGRYAGHAFEVTLSAGPLARLRDDGQPFPMDIALQVGATTFEAQGTARRPFKLEGLDFDVALDGDDLAELYPFTGVPLPPSGPYSLRGRLVREQAHWSFRDFEGRVGDSDLDGTVTVDVSRTPPFMTAELRSARLDLADLGGLIGAPPDEETPTRGPDKIIPDMAIKLDRLHAIDMDVVFEGEEVNARRLPISELVMHLTLRDGKLAIEPLEFGVAGGTISGPLVLDGREDVPLVELDLNLKRIGLAPFLRAHEMADLTQGTFSGNVTLQGRGQSLAEVLATADGHVRVVMTGGTVDPLLVELIGLDIAEALAVVATEDDPIAVHCAVGDMRAQGGRLRIEGMVIDTADSNIWISGSADLRNERLDLRIEAAPKDPSLLSANAPIAITGPIEDPEVAIDPLSTEDEGGVAEAVGDVLNPVLALLPFVELGLAEDTDCTPAEAHGGGGSEGAGTPAHETGTD